MDRMACGVAQRTVDSSVAALESRRGLYRLFNRLLGSEIDQGLLDEMRKPEFSSALGALGISPNDLSGDDDTILEQMAVEFARLFLGPGKHISPHESVQGTRDGTLNNDATVRVRRFIEATGFQLATASKRYPDHICSEFEFMEALISKQIDALTDGDIEEAEISQMLQEEFLQRHLRQWVPGFCSRVEQSAELALYKGLSWAIADFIQIETQQGKA